MLIRGIALVRRVLEGRGEGFERVRDPLCEPVDVRTRRRSRSSRASRRHGRGNGCQRDRALDLVDLSSGLVCIVLGADEAVEIDH